MVPFRYSCLFISLLFAFTNPLLAQLPTAPNAYDAHGLKTGEWINFYNQRWQPIEHPDSATYYRLLTYSQGLPTGPFTDYRANGKRKFMGTLRAESPDVYHGALITYGQSGISTKYSVYLEGVKDYAASLVGFQAMVDSMALVVDCGTTDYGSALNNLALLYNRAGQYAKAEELYLQTIAIYGNTLGTSHQYYAQALNNLAMVYGNMGRYAQANMLYLQSKNILEAALGKTHRLYGMALNNLGLNYQKMERYPEAIPYYSEALAIFETTLGTKSSNYGSTLNNLAIVYDLTGQYSKAEPLYRQALAIQKEAHGVRSTHYATALHNLAGTLQEQNKTLDLAEAYYAEALAIRKKALGTAHPSSLRTMQALSALYGHRNEFTKAITLLEEVLALYQIQLADYFEYMGEQERYDFYQTTRENFEYYTDLALRLAEVYPQGLEKALNIQLQHKAFLLSTSDRIKRRILESGDRRLIDLYDEVQALKQDLGGSSLGGVPSNGVPKDSLMASPLDSLTQLLHAKDRQLTENSTYYKNSQIPATWQAAQAKLEKGEALVEIVRHRVYDYQRIRFTDSIQYCAFIITPKAKTPLVVHFPAGNYMEGAGLAYYQNTIRYQLTNYYSYEQYWQPLANALKKALRKVNTVYFSPDGVFHQINLQTLYNPATQQYLSEALDLRLITTGRELLEEPRKHLGGNLVLLMGNPQFGIPENGQAHIPSLPGTAKEITQLQALFGQYPQWRTQTLVGSYATENALKSMLKPKVLHIATHGYFIAQQPYSTTYNANPLLRAGLILGGATTPYYTNTALPQGNEDGILTAFEAKNLNIDNTDLVVLSACETGLGEIHNGEGVYGLQRALKVAGARSILMSLWKVNDQTTQDLMVSFYRYWLGGMPKRQALHQAQLDLKAKYPHPYYWGAFVLVGE